MSGFFGMVSLRGAPVDVGVLETLTRQLTAMAPDGSSTWHDEVCGLGHALLHTRDDDAPDSQPCTLDGGTWIVADARIDARHELLAKMGLPRDRAPTDDARLILHAFRAWGTSCVEHLLGDFAFAIWDTRNRRLFCARDQFGVKPFFFSLAGGMFAFANSLNIVRRAPGVGQRLDDLAIADFLMFDWREEPGATAFRDVRRLPSAHCMQVTADGTRMRRYWSLPARLRVTYRAANDYVDHFREVLQRAVDDRLTSSRAAVTMSGGLDSTTVAAAAVTAGADVRAYCVAYDRLIPDRERSYAGLVARRLGIAIEFIRGDDYGIHQDAPGLDEYAPEPHNEPCAALALAVPRRAASHARVVLTGWDGDALLSDSPRPYLRELLSRGELLRAGAVAAGFALAERKLVPTSWWRRKARAAAPSFPDWLQPDLVGALRLRERWTEFRERSRLTHPLRPYASYALQQMSNRSEFFDEYTPQCTGALAEYRHPLLDLRVVDLCLSLPPFPWCHRKELLRRAAFGILPEEVRLRPKTPLAGLPYMQLLRQPSSQWLDGFVASAALERYVDGNKLVSPRAVQDPELAWMLMRPIALGRWLDSAHSVQLKEHRYEQA